MQIYHLLLKSKDVSNTAIDGISESSLSLKTNGDNRIEPLVNRDVVEELRHVASSKHLMNRGKVGRPLFRVKVRGKYTPRHTLPP